MAIGMAVVVALTLLASLTLLPALLGYAGERIELTRRRGLIAAGLIAVALDRRRARDPRPAGRHASGRGGRAAGQLRRLLVAQAGARAGAQAAARDVVVPMEPRHPASPVDRRARSAWPRWSRLALPVLGLRLGLLRRRQLPRRHHHPPGLRPAWPKASVPGFNGPLSLATEVPPGTDPAALQAITDAIGADSGVAFVSDPITNDDTDAHRRAVAGRPDDRPARRRDDGPRQPAARRRAPRRHRGHRPRRRRRRKRRRRRRLHRLPVRAAALLLRRGARAVVPAADGRVPLAAGSAQGGHHEPAVDRRRLRRRRRRLPVGLGRRAARHRRGTDRTVRADDAVRHRLRTVDGLRGVPPVPGPRGVGPHRRQPHSRSPTAWRRRPG